MSSTAVSSFFTSSLGYQPRKQSKPSPTVHLDDGENLDAEQEGVLFETDYRPEVKKATFTSRHLEVEGKANRENAISSVQREHQEIVDFEKSHFGRVMLSLKQRGNVNMSSQMLRNFLKLVPVEKHFETAMNNGMSVLKEIGSSHAHLFLQVRTKDKPKTLADAGFAALAQDSDLLLEKFHTKLALDLMMPGLCALKYYSGPTSPPLPKNIGLVVISNTESAVPSINQMNILRALGMPKGFIGIPSKSIKPGTIVGWCNLEKNKGTDCYNTIGVHEQFPFVDPMHSRCGKVGTLNRYNFPYSDNAIQFFIQVAMSETIGSFDIGAQMAAIEANEKLRNDEHSVVGLPSARSTLTSAYR